MTLFFIVVLLCGEMGILAAQRVTAHSPFAGYLAIMPGHPVEAVAAYPCHLQTGILEGVEASFCQFTPEDGVFAAVTIVQTNLIITRTIFLMKSNSIYVGDLVSRWGQPTIAVGVSHYGLARIQLYRGREPRAGHPPLEMVEFHWGDRTVAHVTPVEHLGTYQVYFLPVSYLSMENDEPLWESD
jgi:hypothetical protein